MSSHQCLQSRGAGPGCDHCSVMKLGFCDHLLQAIEMMEAKLAGKSQGIPEQDREEIVAETVTGVLAGAHSFSSRNGAKFTTWVWRIFLNKLCDYYRRQRREVPLGEEDGSLVDQIEGPSDIEDIENRAALRSLLRRAASEDTRGCVGLFILLHEFSKAGKATKDLAHHLGILPNTLNQRVSRCRRIIRKMLEDPGCH